MSISIIHRVLLTVVAAVCLLAASPLGAQDQDDNRLDEAWKDALEEEEPILTPEQFAMLNNLAYQAAVTRVCDGFELDQHKFAEGLEQAIKPASTSLSEDETRHHANAALIMLGMRYGLLIAEGNAAKDDFCANATELKGDPEVPHYWE